MNISGKEMDMKNREKWVAVIGSRHSNQKELAFTRNFAAYLVEQGYIVVSGLALGTDAAAHQGTVDAGGQTIAIVNTPIFQPISPKSNRGLGEDIQKKGCILHPYETAADSAKDIGKLTHFSMRLIERDVLLARLCPKIVVIKDAEGPIEGGTRYGIHYGKQYGQEVMRINTRGEHFMDPETVEAKIWWKMEMDIEESVKKLEGFYG